MENMSREKDSINEVVVHNDIKCADVDEFIMEVLIDMNNGRGKEKVESNVREYTEEVVHLKENNLEIKKNVAQKILK